MTFRVIGQRVKRYDGMSHVTGEAQFVDDVRVPGTLTIKVLRSPVHKGTIRDVDVSAAEATSGVAGVITAADVPNNVYGFVPDQPVLAADLVRYKGQPIAAVAATDEDTALEGEDKIRLQIEEEEPVFDPLEAMKPDAPKVRPEGNFHIFDGRPFRQVVFGDVEEGFKESDIIVEEKYIHPAQEHATIEPMASLAVPDASGRLTIYTVAQAPYLSLRMLCNILKVDPEDVRLKQWASRTSIPWQVNAGLGRVKMVGGTVGGGFGGKTDIHADHVTALRALKTGRPCKWRWTREEDLKYSTYRGPWIINIKDGVKKDGHIMARKIKAIREAGAYSSLNPYVTDKYSFLATGCYFIPNVYVQSYCIFTNKPPASSMRGFGITPSSVTTEIQMDKIAKAIGMDPWEIRFINAYRKGDQNPARRVLNSVALIEVMQALAEKAGVKLPDRLKAMTSAERGEK